MRPDLAIPEPGQIVRVRSRQYLVEGSPVPPGDGDTAHLVRLACLDDDAQGQPLEVLWEHELDAEVLGGESWQRLADRDFDPKALFSAYLHTLRWNCVTATDKHLFQSPLRAGIQLHAYQLEPLRMALALPRVNLFIADDTGLGKTIEAGLIASELLLRRKVKDIVIACPPSVLLQWQDEMESRFGLAFEVLDRAYVNRIRRERGFAANPWDTHTRFIVSHRLLIDEEYAGPLRARLDAFRPGSLLILDEAHNAAPASAARYAIDSQLTHAVRDLARRFEHRLFLSATPHNGHSNSFSSLLEILDEQRFCRGVPVKDKLRDEVMVRRLKEDIRALDGGFPRRNVVQVDLAGVPDDAPEIVLSRLLDEYRQLREERHESGGGSPRRRAAAMLVVTGLQQRLLSSIEAFARTLRVHRRTIEREWAEIEASRSADDETQRPLPLLASPVGADDDDADLDEDDLAASEEAEVEAATRATMGDLGGAPARAVFARERQLLERMTEIADAARSLPDARVRYLVGWIAENLRRGPSAWGEKRVLIFTEYDDTKRYLVEQLRAAIAGSDQADARIAVYHGPTPPPVREEIKRAFNRHPSKHPLRILVATDAAREGVNLQSHCADLFHFDVPWNPGRLEQRNGRIDRKLQPAPEVFCRYFVYPNRPEDRILKVLVQKTERIKRELGSLSTVLDARLAATLKLGISHREIERIERAVESEDLDPIHRHAIEAESEATRKRGEHLKADLEKLRDQLERSQKSLGFSGDHFRAALDAALSLAGAEPLRALPAQGELPESFVFPAIDRRAGADPTWADTIDALRAPRERDQKPWEWRRDAPIRPIVFTAPETMTDEVVQLHLQHRLVERLLGRFVAQGFVHHDLSRACLAQSDDAIPRVVLLGRLALYGNGAARLHEELVAVTARWVELTQRKAALRPLASAEEGDTLALLEKALLPRSGTDVPAPVRARLRAAAPRDVADLLPHLEARAKALETAAAKMLAARATDESKKMVEILESQRERIRDTAVRYDAPQLTLEFDDDARRQLDANRKHWGTRLARIDRELTDEPARIRSVYEVRARRVEPIGLVYLWPVTG